MNLDMGLHYWKLAQLKYLQLYPDAVTTCSLLTDIFDRVFYRGSFASSDLGVNQNYPMTHALFSVLANTHLPYLSHVIITELHLQ
jgi:hypothetical protein